MADAPAAASAKAADSEPAVRAAGGFVAHWRDYLEITKPKVVLLLVFTALVGMALAVPGWLPLTETVIGLLGIGLASGLLVAFVNVLTAVLTFFSLIGYAVVYTVWLKRATPQNIVIGGAAGAMPPVLGWAAVTGEVSAGALLLFLIVFVWTPPHFWALAIHRRDDYAKVDIPMLPVTHGIPFTRIQILLYTILLVVVTVFPWLIGMSGLVYLAGALVLGGMFLYHAIKLFGSRCDFQQTLSSTSILNVRW